MIRYMIFSIDKSGWWMNEHKDISFTRDRAAKFSLEEARDLVVQSNYYQAIDKIPHDVLVPDDYNE